MNNALAVVFVLAILLALSLGLVQALRQAQLTLGYNATAESLYRSVNEYVGQSCAGGRTSMSYGGRIRYSAAESCPGVGAVPTLVHNNHNVCAPWGEPGHLDKGVIDLHGATLEVEQGNDPSEPLSSTPPLLRLLHGGATDARRFLAHLASGQSNWLPYDRDGDGVAEGVQRVLQTRAKVADGLWLAAAGADAGCARMVRAVPYMTGGLRTYTDQQAWLLACDGYTRTVRDDKDQPCAGADCYYPVGRDTAAETWNYGNGRLYEDAEPNRCCTFHSLRGWTCSVGLVGP